MSDTPTRQVLRSFELVREGHQILGVWREPGQSTQQALLEDLTEYIDPEAAVPKLVQHYMRIVDFAQEVTEQAPRVVVVMDDGQLHAVYHDPELTLEVGVFERGDCPPGQERIAAHRRVLGGLEKADVLETYR